jgi:outer membrane protein assembly factor BamA
VNAYRHWNAAARAALFGVALAGLVLPCVAAAAPSGATVTSVRIQGNVKVTSDQILVVVATKAGDRFNPATVESDALAIAKLGFFSNVSAPLVQNVRGGVAVTFRVVENPVVREVRFTGNASVSKETLSALLDTAPGQVYNTTTATQDVFRINSYYDRRGFGGQVPSHVTNVGFGADGVLTVALREGLIVRSMIVDTGPGTDGSLAPDVVKSALVTKPGTPYSDGARDKDYDAIKALYERHDLKLGDIAGGVDPGSVDLAAGTADVRYTVSVLRVAAIEITGNSKTHDDVIRSELRLRPGMTVTDAALRRDYQRLNNLGYFDKIDFEAKPGPDPKQPALVTLDWQVKEKRTATASLGGGYSGGATGTGLTGNVSVGDSNLNGTGVSTQLKVENGSQLTDAQLSLTIPHLGKTEKSHKYSLTTSLFSQRQLNLYPVYSATPAPGSTSAPTTPSGTPVSIVPADPANARPISGVFSNYTSKATGVSASLGRSLSDTVHVSAGLSLQSISASASLPSGFFFPGAVALNPLAPSSSGITGSTSINNALGITAPSIAVMNAGQTYGIHSLLFGATADTRDDVFNPHSGYTMSVGDEVSTKALGSSFNYQLITLDAAKFFPMKAATVAVHARVGTTTGAIPSTKLFTFSDQELRGYSQVFYGTQMVLGQAELRIPLNADRSFSVVGFVDSGAARIAGGTALTTTTSTGAVFDVGKYVFHSDLGIGLRFDIKALGIRTLRLDFAKGSQGMHTSFGIGQSF